MAPSAARTRSRLSATALSGRPTMVKLGRPLLELHLDVDVGHLEAEERQGAHAGDRQ